MDDILNLYNVIISANIPALPALIIAAAVRYAEIIFRFKKNKKEDGSKKENE